MCIRDSMGTVAVVIIGSCLLMQNIIKTHNPALQIRMRIDTRIQDRNADSLSQNVLLVCAFTSQQISDSIHKIISS